MNEGGYIHHEGFFAVSVPVPELFMQGFRQVNLNPVFLIQLNGQAREFLVRFGDAFIEADGLDLLPML